MTRDTQLDSIAALEAYYGEPVKNAIVKEIDHISEHYGAFIAKSPFAIIATAGPEGLDCSPRGDPSGFCQVQDSRTVLIPDRPGNNRIDSLRNIVRDGRISLLFLIPGVGETLRINGRASISIEKGLLDRFIIKNKSPKSVIVVSVDTVYFQCQKALVRSGLWDADKQISRSDLPSTGEILGALSASVDAGQYDRDYPERLKKTIY